MHSLLTWQPIFEWIIIARLKSHVSKINLIQCYVETEVSTIEEKDAFCNQLTSTILNVKNGDIVLVMWLLQRKIDGENFGMKCKT